MGIKEELIKELGSELSSSEKEDLPGAYQMIGDIIILNLKPSLNKHKKRIAEVLLKKLTYVKTVCEKTGEITGEYREPQIKKIAGNGTETIHQEHGCKFQLDVTKLMWAKGNISERKRIGELPRPGEVIIDMFTGLGYFSIPMAVMSKPRVIYSIEKNPVAYDYLLRNIELNKINCIKPILGDSKIEALKLEKADRVIMGYLPEPFEFLGTAFKIIKERAWIHYEGISREDTSEIEKRFKDKAVENGFKTKIDSVTFVKKYKPRNWHVVINALCYKEGVSSPSRGESVPFLGW